MMRAIVLSASLLILASCATPSRLADIPPPAPKHADPRICAKVGEAPAQPAGASIVQPVTVEEQAATSLFLNWVSELKEFNAGLADQMRLAQAEACP